MEDLPALVQAVEQAVGAQGVHPCPPSPFSLTQRSVHAMQGSGSAASALSIGLPYLALHVRYRLILRVLNPFVV